MFVEVHDGDAVRADGRRREVHHAQGRLALAQEGIVADVRRRRGRVEHDVDVGEGGVAGEPLDALVGGCHAEAACAREAVRVRVDAGEHDYLEVPRAAQRLDHQVGANVAAANDGSLDLVHGASL